MEGVSLDALFSAAGRELDLSARLYYDRLGRPIPEDADGERWLVREEPPHLVFVSESGERRVAPLPQAWEHLSAEELEAYCRQATPHEP